MSLSRRISELEARVAKQLEAAAIEWWSFCREAMEGLYFAMAAGSDQLSVDGGWIPDPRSDVQHKADVDAALAEWRDWLLVHREPCDQGCAMREVDRDTYDDYVFDAAESRGLVARVAKSRRTATHAEPCEPAPRET